MSAISFPIEHSYLEVGAQGEQVPQIDSALALGECAITWYELRQGEIRFWPVVGAPRPSPDASTVRPADESDPLSRALAARSRALSGSAPWRAILNLSETSDDFLVLDATAHEHVLPKRAMDALVQARLRELVSVQAQGDPVRTMAPDTGSMSHDLDLHRDAKASGSAWASALGSWLRAGVQLSLTLRVPSTFSGSTLPGATLTGSTLPGSSPSIVLVLGLGLVGLMAGFDYVTVGEPRWFYAHSLLYDAAWILALVVATYVALAWTGASRRHLESLLALLCAALLIPALIGKGYAWSQYYHGDFSDVFNGSVDGLVRGLWAGWIALIATRAISALARPAYFRRLAARGLALTTALVVVFWFPTYPVYFQYDDSEDVLPRVDVERTYYDQPARLEEALAGLAPQRPGVEDIYFIGFAGYADEDVFMREVRNYQRLLDSRDASRGRSVLLINHPSAIEHAPLANRYNLAQVLQHVGELADPKEDTVFLYMTSHGSRDGRFAVRFTPLGLNDVTGQELQQLLIDARIGRRVIAVSACYSGTFLTPLQAPEAIVITAAHAERTSFGCANGRDFTYFGEALRNGLRQTLSFVDAFALARDEVTKREKVEGKKPSLPQISVGPRFDGMNQAGSESPASLCSRPTEVSC